jgi:hypothetical protein
MIIIIDLADRIHAFVPKINQCQNRLTGRGLLTFLQQPSVPVISKII